MRAIPFRMTSSLRREARAHWSCLGTLLVACFAPSCSGDAATTGGASGGLGIPTDGGAAGLGGSPAGGSPQAQGGAPSAGGTPSTASGSGGAPAPTGGSVGTSGSAGSPGSGGKASGGSSQGGSPGLGGSLGQTGGSGSAGAPSAGEGGFSQATGGASTGTGGSSQVSACGESLAVNPTPFGCELAWGANGNQGSRSSYLDFITSWVGYETNGGLGGACDGCRLAKTLASTNAMAVYYAYFIGYQAREDGFGDCNTDGDGQTLCTRGAQWIRDNHDRLIDMYGNYSELTYQASPSKGVLWLLEGDFIQYTYDEQSNPLSMQELGALTEEIVCAIKTNAPNATVAVNHSSWIRDPTLSNYFNAMPLEIIDMVWTTGMGNVNGGYLNTGDANNREDGKYSYLFGLTGKHMLVDTSFGASQQDDSWTDASQDALNQRIADGVIAANVTDAPSDSTYQSRLQSVAPGLSSVCQ